MSEVAKHHQPESLEQSILFRSYVALGLGVIAGVIAFYWRRYRHLLTKKERDYLIPGGFAA